MSLLIAAEVPMAPKTRRFLLLGQLGFGLLFLLMPLSVLWLNPPKLGSQWVLLALLWGPLWFPLVGIIRGKAYTFAWANFIVMIYFVHSLTNLWVSSNIALLLALIELLASCLMFAGCTYYAKFRGQELGLKIPKLKDDPVRQS
ncbi:DUF2069 domain-containing protein [Rheinheimera riviphila]|nr:DUF2069 domain-containing protein [Rheinheimera riviphila]